MRLTKAIRLLMLISGLALVTTNSEMRAMPEYETVYTVWYDENCIISPWTPSHVEGEWVSGCHGEWTGWGWQPGTACSFTVTSQGEACVH